MPDLLRPRDLVEALNVSPATVGRLLRAGAIPSVRVAPKSYRIERQALQEYLAARRRG